VKGKTEISLVKSVSTLESNVKILRALFLMMEIGPG